MTNCFSIFAIHMMTFHLLLHPSSTCFCINVSWSVSLSTTRRGLLTQVDHRKCSKFRASHILRVPFYSQSLSSCRLPRVINSCLRYSFLLLSRIDCITSYLLLINIARIKTHLLHNSWCWYCIYSFLYCWEALQQTVNIKNSFQNLCDFLAILLFIVLCCSPQHKIGARWWWCFTKHMCCHLIINYFLLRVPIIPPQKLQKAALIFGGFQLRNIALMSPITATCFSLKLHRAPAI